MAEGAHQEVGPEQMDLGPVQALASCCEGGHQKRADCWLFKSSHYTASLEEK